MRPAWRLSTSAAFARPSRTALLIAVVALSALLIAAVGVSLGSLSTAFRRGVEGMVGTSDVRLEPQGSATPVTVELYEDAASWPGVRAVVPRLRGSVTLRFAAASWGATESDPTGSFVRSVRTHLATGSGLGIDADLEPLVRPVAVVRGRLPAGAREVALDADMAMRLGAGQKTNDPRTLGLALVAPRGEGTPMKADPGPAVVTTRAEAEALNAAAAPDAGDEIELVRFGREPLRLSVVGIVEPGPFGGTPRAYMTFDGLGLALGKAGELSQVDFLLAAGVGADAFVAERTAGGAVPAGLRLLTTEKITSGLDKNLQANRVGFVLASLMAFIAAGFIIMTGMSVGVTERLRELAILRCVGAERGQLAWAQLGVGLIIGAIGAAIGVPLGLAAATGLLEYFKDELRADVTVPWVRLAGAFAGATLSGVLGAAWPAVQAMRVSPLEALAVRARPARRGVVVALLVAGLAGVLAHLAIFTLIDDGQVVFWTYIVVGLPALMLGYFMLGVPAVLGVSRVIGPLLSRALRLPPRMLERAVAATPYRFGFTAGALMAGLALLVAIWTQGGAAIRDWLGKIQFPDAFVAGVDLPVEAQRALEELPFVLRTCAVSRRSIETGAFGVEDFTRVKSSFVAFEPGPFLEMTSLTWIQGDPLTARRRLDEGGTVIVAREFLTARGMGVGGTFTCWDGETKHDFEIVGVVASPGLELASDFFELGDNFTEQRVHAVFGSRRDLLERFNDDSIGLIQMTLDPAVGDEEAMAAVREKLAPYGIYAAGSGRQIKKELLGVVESTLVVASSVAVFSMLVASLGVATLVEAGIQARRFEFGVLRAVGASRGLLTRIVIGETLVVAVTACVLGTFMGVQGAFGGTRLNALLWGLDLKATPPAGPIALAWVIVTVLPLAAAAPATIALGRKQPRELRGATKG